VVPIDAGKRFFASIAAAAQSAAPSAPAGSGSVSDFATNARTPAGEYTLTQSSASGLLASCRVIKRTRSPPRGSASADSSRAARRNRTLLHAVAEISSTPASDEAFTY
jgi:hypothetical protein